MPRPSSRSWAGGLYKRLLARGFDPYSAKMVARHVRADARGFLQQLLDELTAIEVREMEITTGDVDLAIERVMGVEVT